MSKKPKDGAVLKSDVLWIIQDYIRGIQMLDHSRDSGIPQLYAVMDQIEKMDVQEASWIRDEDGAWKCTHCGNRFFNVTGRWIRHCERCGFEMIR